MSTGGIFQLISNDGKQDKMLMATELLNERLAKCSRDQREKGEDPLPKLRDIEKTHVLFMHAHYKPFVAVGYEYNKVQSGAGQTTLGSTLQFSIPQFGDFFHDMVFHVVLSAPSLTKAGGSIEPSGRWANFLGERLCEKVAFKVNGNPLDDYTYDAYNFHREFHVPDHKKRGWYRCVGQEVPYNGFLKQQLGSMSNTPDNYRFNLPAHMGPQTPTGTMSSVEMFVPLIFWCNKDPRLSVPSVAIPYGQRFVEITLAAKTNLCSIDARGGTAGPTLGDVSVTTAELYINNIFVNPEVHRIFMKRIGFTMIRVHRTQTMVLNKDTDDVLLKRLKWPIEHMFVGVRRTSYATVMDKWNLFSYINTSTKDLQNVAAYYEDDGSTALTTLGNIDFPRVDVDIPYRTLATMDIKAHGISLYNNFPAAFFGDYIPYHYGGQNISTPEDRGAMMVNFCLMPGSYQPSGHLNLSRAREFYLKYTTNTDESSNNIVSSSNTGTLVVVASAINFLLISDGSATLRYTT